MTIDMNWAEVSKVADATRELTEQVASRINAALTNCDTAATSHAGFVMAGALAVRQQSWADELSDLVRRTMIAADKLDDSALLTRQSEEQNTRAVNALLGLL